ncbi:carboxypeptidase regulatory-like domain-containing protein [Sphingobium sp. AR-3-1]|uniref:Carboxypeptidase regulatory-like domain-containing protein n=1 Tax=Sphingobium psychrophilum TaxID=2728834 RepID=A0A7X9WWE0_9SPHN|nr:carboxypeptidase regulatory-like domain-containing protein [Sphingobium psychrophilum]NML11136.1 carboxypeptidase regulatory-like domain-containing protein [Sphingobium psychrophilum]
MTIQWAVMLILGFATFLAWVRLSLWHSRGRRTGQASPVRLALLMLLQPLVSALLYYALFPPMVGGGPTDLRIATAGTSRLAAAVDGAPLILLPEAPAIGGGEATPDLATALRRHPGVRTITVLGKGLGPRDIDAARQVAVEFDSPPLRPGILNLTPPPTAPAGGRFVVGGTLAGLSEATVELIDPAGRVTDSGSADRDGHFLLAGTARAAGAVNFTLRARKDKRLIEQADVPVWVTDSTRPRLLILAGAPGPEAKYLRRWASDAGFDVTTQMSAGGGIALGDAPVALDAAGLRRFDVAIVDDRAWAGLRGPLIAAVRGGLGLVLRAGGAIDGVTRSQWQALGFGLSGPGGVAPLALPNASDEAVARTRHGIGSDEAPVDMALPEDFAPDVGRLGLTPGGGEAVPMLQDAGGATLGAWRAIGIGRVALFTGIDSYVLTLTGRRDLYGDWWNGLLTAVARPAPSSHMIPGILWAGERMALCDIGSDGQVENTDSAQTRLAPVAGCGAFWPARAGWHQLRVKDALRPFYVQSHDALPTMRAARDRQAMAMRSTTTPGAPAVAVTTGGSGSAWPFWVAWLVASALLWWLERSRVGRRVTLSSGQAEPALATASAAP